MGTPGKTEFEKKKQRHASGESTMSADSVSHYIPTPPDGGYGWVIVIASFLIHVIVDGIAFTFGVFYVEFLDYFGEGKGKTSLVGSLLAGCYLLAAPIASGLINKFGTRKVAFAGGLLAWFSFLLSTWAPSINVLMLTYGIMGGTGLGLAYLPSVVAVSFYFQKRRAVATGIAVCGAGVGTFIFAPAGKMLLDIYDWQDAMLILSGVVLNICAFGALLRPLEPPRKKTKPRAKNVFDRLMELARSGRHRQDSECSACTHGVNSRGIIERVEEVKLARQKALSDNESEFEFGSVPNSIMNSTRKLESSPGHHSVSVSRSEIPHHDVVVAGSPGGESVTLPEIVIEDEDDDRSKSHDDSSSLRKESGISTMSHDTSDTQDDVAEITSDDEQREVVAQVNTKEQEVVLKPALKKPKSRLDQIRMEQNRNGSLPNKLPQFSGMAEEAVPLCTKQDSHLAVPNGRAQACPTSGWDHMVKMSARNKCPPGVHREDYSRPMYRQDIFYSGSIVHIPQFRSQPTVNTYVKSVTSIPASVAPEDEKGCWKCVRLPKSIKDTLKQMMDFGLLKDPVFMIICLTNLFGAVGLFIPFIYIADRSISLGVSVEKAAFLLSIIGITNTLGRVGAGLLADIKCVNTLALHNSALVLGGLVCFLNHFCTTYPLQCVFAAIFGACVATWISLTSIVLCDLLGIQKLSNAFGLLTMARGLASIVGPPIAGFVFDATMDFNASFYIGGAMLLLAGLLCCLLHLPFCARKSLQHLESDLCAMDIGPLPDDSDDEVEPDCDEV